MPDRFSGQPSDWEEWSWNFKAYLAMFDSTSVSTLERIEENPTREITDDDMTVMLDALDVDQEATAKRVLFSRKLHYLLAQLVKESARLVVRQNVESNGFETWRRLYNRFALPDATRATSLLTQLLDFRFNPSTFEQDFNTWETLKVKYERQTGAELPDGVLVATLLNKTSGALQQHLRLNFADVPADPRHDRGVLSLQAHFDFGQFELAWRWPSAHGHRLSRKRQRKERKRKRKERKRKRPTLEFLRNFEGQEQRKRKRKGTRQRKRKELWFSERLGFGQRR